MARTVGIGLQSFEKIQQRQCFYVDKTKFIKDGADADCDSPCNGYDFFPENQLFGDILSEAVLTALAMFRIYFTILCCFPVKILNPYQAGRRASVADRRVDEKRCWIMYPNYGKKNLIYSLYC